MKSNFPFTDVVITASHSIQASAYRAQIRSRVKKGSLPIARFHVIADPGGVRVGSGLATIHALTILAKKAKVTTTNLLQSRRILILHSGGDSRRLPAYAAQGKLFLPLPRIDDRGDRVSLFDLIINDFTKIQLGHRGRVVVAAGDLYLNLGDVRLEGSDIIGVTCRASVEVGSRHGVYVNASNGSVIDFLQKPTPADATRAKAVSRDGTVAVDTGVISFSPRAANAIIRACSASITELALRGDRPLDLYEHVMIALAGACSDVEYARSLGKDSEHRTALRLFRKRLPKLSISTVTGQSIRFNHIGTTKELLERLGTFLPDPKRASSIVMDATFGETTVADQDCVIDSSTLSRSAKLGGRNVLVGIPSKLNSRIVLPRGIGLVTLPIGRADWCCIAFGDRDDFKSSFSDGGTLLNRKHPSLSGTAWELPIWHVGSIHDSFSRTMSLIHGTAFNKISGDSLASIIPRVNHARLLAHREETARLARLRNPGEYLRNSHWMTSHRFAEDATSAQEARAVCRQLVRFGKDASPTLRARASMTASILMQRYGFSRSESARAAEAAFESVRSSVVSNIRLPTLSRNPPVHHERIVWASSPARIDLFGGWTDTPPICTDVGGCVVNAAAVLNGQYPLQAICRRIEEPIIRLNSIDLGGSIVIRHAQELQHDRNNLDWSTLPKAALEITGFCPPAGSTLQKHLESHGGGLDVTVFSALPKGSGMGASSILGATLIAALLRSSSEQVTATRVIELTSALEQRMSTGGGWQDQVGGIVPGVKMLHTHAGELQIPSVTRIATVNALTTTDGQSRLLLYYTGRTRLAKNILRTVVGRYLARQSGIRSIIDRLKSGASDMTMALNDCDLGRVGRLLNEYWSLKKQIDPGSTDDRLNELFDLAKQHIDGGTLLGAGGGGFALFIAKSERHAMTLRSKLEPRSQSNAGRFYDLRIDNSGLNVSVL
jgi:fucokinase